MKRNRNLPKLDLLGLNATSSKRLRRGQHDRLLAGRLSKLSTVSLKQAVEQVQAKLRELRAVYPEQWRLRGVAPVPDEIEREMGLLEREIERGQLELLRRNQPLTLGRGSVAGTALSLVRTDFQHAPDFRSIKFEGHSHTLTGKQAQVIEALHAAWLQGTPSLGTAHILEKLDTPASRLRDTFKRSDLWGTLIVRGKKRGTVRLNLPDNQHVPKP